MYFLIFHIKRKITGFYRNAVNHNSAIDTYERKRNSFLDRAFCDEYL